MQTWKDTNGREWNININVSMVSLIKKALNVDLWNLLSPEELAKLDDPEQLTRVLYLVCRNEATAAGITEDKFYDGLAGDTFDEAQTALLNAVADYYPLSRREPLKVMTAKFFSLRDEAVAKSLDLINKITLDSVGAIPAAVEQ